MGKSGAAVAQFISPRKAWQRNMCGAWESERCHAMTRANKRCRAPALSDEKTDIWSKRLGVDLPHGVCQYHAQVIARMRGNTIVWPWQLAKRCRARRKDGMPCRNPAMLGTPVCTMHGAREAPRTGTKHGARSALPDGSILHANVRVRRNLAKAGVGDGA
jgi:hypothetical protein